MLLLPSPSSPPRANRSSTTASPETGFTMIEMMLVMVVMTMAVSMLASTVSSSSRLGPLQSQRATASEGAREKLEHMRTMPFEQLWALYNDDPADDPGGPGTAPGPNFAVPGLPLVPGDPDGFVGRVRFPGTPLELREDADDAMLGMPRDLDLDRTVSAVPLTEYSILPAEVSVQWESGGEERVFAAQTMFIAP